MVQSKFTGMSLNLDKLWGGEWEKTLEGFKVNVILPVKNESEIRYWTHML